MGVLGLKAMLVTWVTLILILCLFQSLLFLSLCQDDVAEAGEGGRDQSIHKNLYFCWGRKEAKLRSLKIRSLANGFKLLGKKEV